MLLNIDLPILFIDGDATARVPARASIVACGHTRRPFDRRAGSTRLVNAGSVGMPFAKAGACWLLLGPDVRLSRTSRAEQLGRHNVLHPPTEEETIAAFSRFELQ
jgi:hypothetical protein